MNALEAQPNIYGAPLFNETLSLGRVASTTTYELRLPHEGRPGRVMCEPQRNMGYNPASDYAQEICNLDGLAKTGLHIPLALIGYSVGYDAIRRGGIANFPAPETLSLLLPPNESAADSNVVGFLVHEGGSYKATELADAIVNHGAVPLSRSTKALLRDVISPYGYYEAITYLGHDILTHVPAWLSVPPHLFGRIRAALRGPLEVFNAAEIDSPERTCAEAQLKLMAGRIDGGISAHGMASIAEHKGERRYRQTTEGICKVINAPVESAGYWEREIYRYMSEPTALTERIEASLQAQKRNKIWPIAGATALAA
ncbi:MAG TPA: hypothetical protein VLH38_03505 [Patescibacteria group bacterium]|nr:hypothetical protein [Patescibacteria group bacterium]